MGHKPKIATSACLGSILFLFANCGSSGSAENQQATHSESVISENEAPKMPDSREKNGLEYEPAIVELEGKLVIKTFFGPPNFGEEPKTDSKERTWILSLTDPINVRAKMETDPILGPSVENAGEVQLVLRTPRREFIGKQVIVKGTLFHAHTGHHHTDLLIDVESIHPGR